MDKDLKAYMSDLRKLVGVLQDTCEVQVAAEMHTPKVTENIVSQIINKCYAIQRKVEREIEG